MILCATLAATNAYAQRGTPLRIALITPSTATASSVAIVRGVKLGVGEAAQTAKLFGGDVQLVERLASSSNAVAAANSVLDARQIQVLIAVAAADVDALSRLAENRHIIFLDVASRSNSARSICRNYTFHVEASDAMYGKAKANAGRGGAGDSVVLWDPALSRFGASELNNRFTRTFNSAMTGGAWAGWAAVKFASEAALRARSNLPSAIEKYFASAPTQFDGHKGWPLSFRQSDHQLRQPLYIVGPGKAPAHTVTDVPDLRALSSGMAGNANQLLDQLVPDKPVSPCRAGAAAK